MIEFIKNKLSLLSIIHQVDGIEKNVNSLASSIEQYAIGALLISTFMLTIFYNRPDNEDDWT